MLRTDLTASAFDRDNSFLPIEIDGETLGFRAITRTGATVDEETALKAAARRGGLNLVE